MNSLLPVLQIPSEALTESQDLDPATLFKTKHKETYLEIGFGNGERLAEDMRQNPDCNYLGAEPFINGMAAFLKDLSQSSLHGSSVQSMDHTYKACDDGIKKNIRVIMDDAMLLCHSLTDESLDRIYVLNPDPWHKTRHHKRRIVNPESLNCFARILKPGGKLIMSTDVPDLADWMITHTFNHPAFTWEAEKAGDWRNPPLDWIQTRYETKGAKGAKKMTYLFFEK